METREPIPELLYRIELTFEEFRWLAMLLATIPRSILSLGEVETLIGILEKFNAAMDDNGKPQ